MVALSELILQIVTYFHVDSHRKQQRGKMHMQMRAFEACSGVIKHKIFQEIGLIFSNFYSFLLYLLISNWELKTTAHLAGAVEYTDCISAEE